MDKLLIAGDMGEGGRGGKERGRGKGGSGEGYRTEIRGKRRVEEEGREREGQGVCWAELERVGEQSLEGGTGHDNKVLDSWPMPCLTWLGWRLHCKC
jgi:hypothetical protein